MVMSTAPRCNLVFSQMTPSDAEASTSGTSDMRVASGNRPVESDPCTNTGARLDRFAPSGSPGAVAGHSPSVGLMA